MSGGGVGNVAGLLLGGGQLAAGLLGKQSADKAAQLQSQALKDANALQLLMYQQTRKDLGAYRNFGAVGMNKLLSSLDSLTKPFNPTMAQLEKTPGYQFTLQEGLKAKQNAYTAQGLGLSGTAMKGAEDYAAGLASTTFQQQLQDYMAQNAQKYNMLMGLTQIGAGAAAGTAGAGQFAGANIGAGLAGIGQAQAAGLMAGTNALTGGINNALNSVYQWNLMNRMYPGG